MHFALYLYLLVSVNFLCAAGPQQGNEAVIVQTGAVRRTHEQVQKICQVDNSDRFFDWFRSQELSQFPDCLNRGTPGCTVTQGPYYEQLQGEGGSPTSDHHVTIKFFGPNEREVCEYRVWNDGRLALISKRQSEGFKWCKKNLKNFDKLIKWAFEGKLDPQLVAYCTKQEGEQEPLKFHDRAGTVLGSLILDEEAVQILQKTDIKLRPCTYLIDPKAFFGVPHLSKLTSLHIEGHKVPEMATETLSFLKGLKELHITNSELKCMGDVTVLQALEILNLSGNKLEKLPKQLSRLKALRELYAGNNGLTYIPELLPKSLRVLDVRRNKLKKFPFIDDTCSHLRSIRVGNNRCDWEDREFKNLQAYKRAVKQVYEKDFPPIKSGPLSRHERRQLKNEQQIQDD